MKTTLNNINQDQLALLTVLDGAIQPITNDKGATTLARGKPFKLASGKVRIQLVRSLGVCRKELEEYEKTRVGMIKEITGDKDDIDAWRDEEGISDEERESRVAASKKFYKDVDALFKDEREVAIETKVKLSEVLNLKTDKKDTEEGNIIPGSTLERLISDGIIIDDISDTPKAEKKAEKDPNREGATE